MLGLGLGLVLGLGPGLGLGLGFGFGGWVIACCFLLGFFARGAEAPAALASAAAFGSAAGWAPLVTPPPLPGTMGCTPCLHTHMTSPVSL